MLTCKVEEEITLMVCDGTMLWKGTLTAAELNSMANEARMDAGAFISEAERAITVKSRSTQNFVYDVSHDDDGGLHLTWKRHLPADKTLACRKYQSKCMSPPKS